jgi:hypothetical protein
MACLFAAAPTNLSPSLVKAIVDGVVLEPYGFSITLGVLPSIIATQELVVPKSMPMTEPVFLLENPAKREFLNIARIICLFIIYHRTAQPILIFNIITLTSLPNIIIFMRYLGILYHTNILR